MSAVRLSDFRHARELETLLPAVRAACLISRRVQGSPDRGVVAKADGSPVTAADYAAQAILCEAVAAICPGDPVMAEEKSALLRESPPVLARVLAEVRTHEPRATDESVCRWIDHSQSEGGAGRYWAIDPIDGTQGFVRGDHYAVCIALIENGLAELGIVGCPNVADPRSETGQGSILLAVRDQGCFSVPLSGPAAGELEPVRVSPGQDPTQARFCESVEAGHTWHESTQAVAKALGTNHPPLRIDSQAKFALVARGDAEIYLRVPVTIGRHERVWDVAPGAILVEEAGGRVTDINGHPLEFQHGLRLFANRGLVASSGAYHDAVVSALHGRGVV
jgi:3'(2'), 5'-bisphosphate nucleotidase